MIILSIETSCDETAISIIKVTENKNKQPVFKILADEIASQIDIHKKYGGVYPMLAKREHIKNLPILFKKTLEKANLSNGQEDIDLIAVTQGPGLEPALWTGINFATELAKKMPTGRQKKIPIIPVNHMEGHIFSASVNRSREEFIISDFQFPAMALLISGGHTELVLIKDWLKYKIIGQTRDDAVGEAFDKVARLLGFPYPGGPEISKLTELGGGTSSGGSTSLKLPRPMINSGDYDFSFAGLKTAVLYKIREIKNLTDEIKIGFAREFQNAVIDILINKTIKASEEYNVKTILLGGGVSANKQIQNAFKSLCKKNNIKLLLPQKNMITDNSLMIAIAGYIRYKHKKSQIINSKLQLEIIADGNLKLS